MRVLNGVQTRFRSQFVSASYYMLGMVVTNGRVLGTRSNLIDNFLASMLVELPYCISLDELVESVNELLLS